MERIVFNQQELDLVGTEVKYVALCDNHYVIRPVRGREYIAIGTVSAVVGCTAIEAIAMGLVFIGFNPVFDESIAVKEVKCEPSLPVCSFTSSFASSFSSSFKTSFKTSYLTSFRGLYEYTAFRHSSFSGSFSGGSMRLNTSFPLGQVRKRTVVREVAVNGYGLNLI